MNFVTKEPINKGWSIDKKYCVTDENGTRYLLRVSDIAQRDTKQSEFNMMKQVAFLGIPMCQPIEFGTCEDGVYSIQSWIDGEDAEQVMSNYSDTEQYVYGLEAGRILHKIHIVCTFVLSLSIEFLQPLINGFRSSDITDLLTNTVGGIIGYLCYILFKPAVFKVLARIKSK